MSINPLYESLALVDTEVELLVASRLKQLKETVPFGQRDVSMRSVKEQEESKRIDSDNDDGSDYDDGSDDGSDEDGSDDGSDGSGDEQPAKRRAVQSGNGKRAVKCRRSKLPLRCVYILRAWFEEHVAHPYPNDAHKRELAGLTGLSPKQISCWFTNTRRRIWQPFKSQTSSDNGHILEESR